MGSEVRGVVATARGDGCAVCGECRSCRRGRLDLDRFVSDPDDVEEAFYRMERGEVLRSVVVL
jgi:hypothetical protein